MMEIGYSCTCKRRDDDGYPFLRYGVEQRGDDGALAFQINIIAVRQPSGELYDQEFLDSS